ncbi:MAG: efflux RND transporter periplasmic adaptor subunit, partial [Planctomycetes bacterium]|nr:efflux RND transporter periplasmic adaptor subunit [Planctomycetota bacterium]
SQAIATTEVAQAAQAQAQARLENATLEKDRAENLYKDNSIPKQKYDAAVAAYKIALAGRDLAAANLHVSKASLSLANVGRKQALAALEELDTRIADYTVRAPIAGIVTARFVDQGAMDNPAIPIVEIMDTSILKVCCDVAQVNAGKVREGQPVTLSVDAYPGAAFAGTVTIVNPSLDPKTRTLPIEIHTDGKPSPEKTAEGALLRPGMFVNLSIKIGKKTTLAIPRDCLLRLPGTGVYYLFVVKDSKAEKRTVQVGIGRGNIVEITSGLKVGESVVIQGQANLKTGTAVMEEKGTD